MNLKEAALNEFVHVRNPVVKKILVNSFTNANLRIEKEIEERNLNLVKKIKAETATFLTQKRKKKEDLVMELGPVGLLRMYDKFVNTKTMKNFKVSLRNKNSTVSNSFAKLKTLGDEMSSTCRNNGSETAFPKYSVTNRFNISVRRSTIGSVTNEDNPVNEKELEQLLKNLPDLVDEKKDKGYFTLNHFRHLGYGQKDKEPSAIIIGKIKQFFKTEESEDLRLLKTRSSDWIVKQLRKRSKNIPIS